MAMKMIHSDAETRIDDNLFSNIHTIDVNVILEIQKDVDTYDMVSLVFLLYDVPDTALQRLIVYQRVSKDIETSNMNLLYDWALYAQSQPTWRYKFLEALTICRLYNIIRKLGFNVSNIKKHYLPENVHVTIYIDPMKKLLYKICENMTVDCLIKLKKSLNSYKINVLEHESCEIIFLELMCQKFIKIGQYNQEKKVYSNIYDIEELAKIFENLSILNTYAATLRDVQNQINNTDKPKPQQITNAITNMHITDFNSSRIQSNKSNEGFDEIFHMLNELDMENASINFLKSDTTDIRKDAYVLKNKKRIGICCIINQEIFYPSQDSIRSKSQPLSDRTGSTLDLMALEETMTSQNFKVISRSNLDHKEVFAFLKEVITKHVKTEDSVFMLCILSHGVRGHIFAADSNKIKIEDIQNLLDSEDAKKLHDMPKVLILQACQSNPEQEINNRIESDSPQSNFYLRKSHFLIYWATAPEYEAYRLPEKGTIFIQCLCVFIKMNANNEHLFDIFTKVTDCVSSLCTKLQRAQVPIFESTLRKKLYLT